MRYETGFTISADTANRPENAPPAQKGFTLRRYRVSNFRSVMDSGWHGGGWTRTL